MKDSDESFHDPSPSLSVVIYARRVNNSTYALVESMSSIISLDYIVCASEYSYFSPTRYFTFPISRILQNTE